MISEQDIPSLLDKRIVITNLAGLKNVDELCHFLRLTGHSRKCVPLFTDIMKPLSELLKKDTQFQWPTPCQSAIKHLKNVLCKKPILQYTNVSKPYTFFTDTRSYAYSGILAKAVDGPDDLRPITHTLGFFSDTQQRWSAADKEAFAV